jgi:hypothetical protein
LHGPVTDMRDRGQFGSAAGHRLLNEHVIAPTHCSERDSSESVVGCGNNYEFEVNDAEAIRSGALSGTHR